MNSRRLAAVCVFGMCVPLLSQRTWIVDRQERPGFDFTNIQPAVDAAAPGDIVLLRYVDFAATGLWYEAAAIGNKGISILGEEGPRSPVVGRFDVTGVPVGQSLTIGNIGHSDRAYDPRSGRPWRGIWARDCRGAIHFVNIVSGGPPGTAGSAGSSARAAPIRVERCDMVTIANCELWASSAWAAADISGGSRVFATNSLFGGTNPFDAFVYDATIGLWDQAELWLTDCLVMGTDGWMYPPFNICRSGTIGIGICNARLHVLGRTDIYGGMECAGRLGAVGRYLLRCLLPVPDSPTWLDPRSRAFDGLGNVTIHHGYQPGLDWIVDAPSQTVVLRQYSEPYSPMLFATSSLQPTPLTLSVGDLYLEPGCLQVLAVVAGNAQGYFDLVLPVAPWPALGVSVGVQGAQLDAAGQVVLTPPIAPGRY
ncbi:MAG: hypothetical protein IPK26_15635 [Planctomycetes bacterium]|nr:hypothetical protein [Planctomycetota bacterium]